MNTDDLGTFVGRRDEILLPRPDRRHYLVVVRGLEPHRRVELDGKELVVGREAACGLVLGDQELSKRHCSVVLRDGRVVVTDLGSTNGSYIDGRPLKPSGVLPLESILQVGGHALRHEFRDRAEVERDEAQAADLRRARAYVEALLPARRVDGAVLTDWVFVPCAALGGDAFGCHDLPDGRVAFYLLDVCGHGARAAMHSVAAIHHIRSGSLPGADRAQPSQMLSALNTTFGMDEHDGMYFSIWYGVWNPATRELSYASAGHPPPLLASPDGTPGRPLFFGDPPIGVLPEATFGRSCTIVAPGSRLYVFSDGAYEIRLADGSDWSYGDFAGLIVAEADGALPDAAGLHARVMKAATGHRLDDDLTILVVTFP